MNSKYSFFTCQKTKLFIRTSFQTDDKQFDILMCDISTSNLEQDKVNFVTSVQPL